MSMRDRRAQAFAARSPAVRSGHLCRGPGFVNEHEAFGFQIELTIEPRSALAQDVWAVLFDRVPGLFLRVMPRRSKNRHKVPIPM